MIRRKLKPPKREPPVRVERRWKLKPVSLMSLSLFSPGEGGRDTLEIRLPENPNPREFDCRFGNRGRILDALARTFDFEGFV